MHQCHNDYLRVFFETGALGLICFLMALVWQVRWLKKAIAGSDGRLQQAFAGVYLGLLALIITSLTDNSLGYNLQFTNPLFVLLGSACGVVHAERAEVFLARNLGNMTLDRPAPRAYWSREQQGGLA